MATLRPNRKRILAVHLNSLCWTALALAKLRRRSKTWWTHPLWRKRGTEGAYQTLIKSMKEADPVFFKKYLRMSPDEFKELHELVKSHLTKYPAGRPALTTGHRLAIAIRFLASGDSLTSISFAFRIGFSTAHLIVKEVCDALWIALAPTFLSTPTEEKWKRIADEFCKRWQFPNCLGAVDGKHIQITCPAKSGTMFYNYKGFFSTVLMAVVDSNYKFIVVDIGGYGSNSDGGLWKFSTFGQRYDADRVNAPKPKPLPSTTEPLPFVMIGDEAFQLRPNFLRPFPAKHLTEESRVFNYRLSRARRCVENAFGILAARWRILRKPIHMKPENVDRAVKACIVLHNFLKSKIEESSVYCPKGYADYFDGRGNLIDGEWRDEINLDCTAFRPVANSSVRNFSSQACNVRNKFLQYFNTLGAVPWQSEAAGINEVYTTT